MNRLKNTSRGRFQIIGQLCALEIDPVSYNFNSTDSQNEQGYVVAPPEGGQFNPPKDIQTIYVPPENAINIPENFGVDVGSSFGYDESAQLALSPSSSSFSFDNPAFNAPQVFWDFCLTNPNILSYLNHKSNTSFANMHLPLLRDDSE